MGKTLFSKDNKLSKKIELLEKEQGRLYGIVGELTAKNDWLNWKNYRDTSKLNREKSLF